MEEKEQTEQMIIQNSVRGLVEFLLRSGDIDNRKASAPENAMQEGSRIHRMIQRRMGADYQAEVSLKYKWETEKYTILIEGRADGIIKGTEEIPTIDEIKGTYLELTRMKDAFPVHVAQAKCYAFIYASEQKLPAVRIRMTYCNIDTEEIRYFHYEYSIGELRGWFTDILEKYKQWADFQYEWKVKRQESIKGLQFPFPYRTGQKDLVTYVYQTIYHKKKLFVEAPTGSGKTISSLFPSIKSIGEGRGDKLFYLTAKTITRTVAADTLELLRRYGLQFKSVILTAKDKICFMEERECNPDYCPYAKGHYDRINAAVYDLLTHTDNFTRETIEEYAVKHNVCPFELCLDMSLFCDAIIGDYNYVFDPHVYLKRFFAEGVKGDYIFLIDEAHNLVERGREMYSASLCKEDFLKLRHALKESGFMETGSKAGELKKIDKCLEKGNKELLTLKRECENYRIEEFIDPFAAVIQRLSAAIEKYLEESEDRRGAVHENEIREKILAFYFEISHFLFIYEKIDANYVMFSQLLSNAEFVLKLFCVNPSVNLQECMRKGRSTILFSATLLPITYYKDLLGAEEGDYDVYAKSVFNPNKRALLIASDVTSKYARRTDMEFYNIASYIHEITKNRHGNYMIFFPSHVFLQQVLTVYLDYFYDADVVDYILQEDHMDERAREDFLKRFAVNTDCDMESLIHMNIDIEEEEDKSLIGFCVMGGIFSEGIDLKRDSLIGVIVVGTGIPQVCNEREILKNYFDAAGDNGFDYAYRYPGMNKVLQASGRVIRTSEDIGIVVLLDERFLNPYYRRLFPMEWEEFETVTVGSVSKKVENFWNEWL